jgi:hypothetical protein
MATLVKQKPPLMNMATAWAHTEAVHASFSSRKQKLFFDRDLQIERDPLKSVSGTPLVDKVAVYYLASKEYDKFDKALKIFSKLEKMDTSTEVAERIRRTTELLERRRLDEIPQQLALLIQMKQFVQIMSEYVEGALPAIQGERWYRDYCEKDTLSGTPCYRFKRKPSQDEIVNFMTSSHGYAFVLRYARLFTNDNPFVLDNFPEKEFQMLERFVKKSSVEPTHFAYILYEFIKSIRAQNANHANQVRFLHACESIGGPYSTRETTAFLDKAFPSLMNFFDYFRKHAKSIKQDNADRKMYEFILNLHRKGQELAKEKADLDACYASLYQEYWHLKNKGAVPSVFDSIPTPSAFQFFEDVPFVLPTPTAYANIAVGFAPRDLSKEMSPDALFPTQSPAASPVTVKASPSPTPPPAFRAITPPAPKKDKKDDKDRSQSAPALLAAPSASPTPLSQGLGGLKESSEPKTPSPAAAPAPKVKVECKEPMVAFRSIIRDDRKSPAPTAASSIFANRKFPYKTIEYKGRVNKWLKVAKKEYDALPLAQQQRVWKHAFKHVDHFLGTRYCREGKWQNPETGEWLPAFAIHGEVKWRGRVYGNVFQYTFAKDKDGVFRCFHRWFGKKSGSKMFDMIFSQKMYDVNYPPLQKGVKYFHEKAKNVRVQIPGEVPCVIDEEGKAHFVDEEHELEITLNPLGED